MKINYCLPIIKNSKKEVLDVIQKNRNEYEYLEVWLDSIMDADKPFIDKLIYMLQDQLILVFHRGNNIKTTFSPDQKREVLDLLDNSKTFIDLDISEKDELAYLKKIKVKTIISYHNYKETPVDLAEKLKEMDKLQPDIYKISTMCKNEMDAIKLLMIQQNLKVQNKNHIILGMGKFGTITRVYGTLFGNKMIYAPKTKQEASAPGQLTKQELENILKILITNH